MKNLAGDKRADQYIKDELERARIPILSVPLTKDEVPYTLVGQLGDFTFTRAWYYWMVAGRFPLERAKVLYADPAGKQSVRVSGHCGCPPPEDPRIDYFAVVEGVEKKVLHGAKNLQDLADAKKRKAAGETSTMIEIWGEIEKSHIVSLNPLDVPGVKAFITSYHIDDLLGLRLFADQVHEMLEEESK